MVQKISTHCFHCGRPWDVDIDALIARAKKAEAERDVLAEALAWGAGKDKKSLFDKLPWFDSRKKWLEWAAQEAAKRVAGEVE